MSMKKVLLALSLFVALLASGCGNNGANPTPNVGGPPQVTPRY